MTDAERIADLTERLRMVPVLAHVKAFDSLIGALEDRKITLADLHRVVSPERIRAALIEPRALRTPPHHA